MRTHVCCVALLALLCHAFGSNPLNLEVQVDGSFQISWADEPTVPWFTSGSTFFRSDNVTYSSRASKGTSELKRQSLTKVNGTSHLWGNFDGYVYKWLAGKTVVEGRIKHFHDHPMIIFEYNFPESVKNVQLTGDDADNRVSSAWPSFNSEGKVIDNLAVMNFDHLFDRGSINTGTSKFQGGAHRAGGFPLVFYNKKLRTVILSPTANFKAGVQTKEDKEIRCGIQGMIKDITANFTHSTVLYAGDGVNPTIMGWGELLLKTHGKPVWPHNTEDDFTVRNLAYYTDNGAYYYYKTIPGTNYEDTMKTIKKQFDDMSIPVTNYQLDSWWYYQDKLKTGVTEWIARPDIFPHGMRNLTRDILQTQVVLHNRWWSPETPYAEQYPFYKEKDYAIPIYNHSNPESNPFFDHLFSTAKEWNCTVYEQDWLVNQYLDMKYTREHLWAAHDWHVAMGRGADNNNMKIQYCMPLLSDFLQSVQSKSVSQIRVSDDNMPGWQAQWRIGKISLIAYALGMAPFKDIFWTTTVQEGNPYYGGNGVEPNPELEAIVSILTAGPVGFGDKLGHTNKTLIMMTCSKNGTLLQPDHPAVTPDFVFRGHFAKNMHDVVITGNQIGNFITKYILVTDTTEELKIQLSDITSNNDARFVAWEHNHPEKRAIVDSNNVLHVSATGGSKPYYSSPKNGYDPKYHPHALYIMSIFHEGWSILGEYNKFVSFSHRRFYDVHVTNGELNMNIYGVEGEIIEFGYFAPDNKDPFFVPISLQGTVTKVVCSGAGVCRNI